MENCNDKKSEERKTLMQAFERLDYKCSELRDVADMTERLYEKLNRTEWHPKCNELLTQKEIVVERNIVELFNLIAEKIEVQINVIGNNTEKSMIMID